MAYLTIDLNTPVKNEYILSKRLQNTILKYWPKKVVNGVEVFDKFIYYSGGVRGDTAAKELYKVLGTSYGELVRQNYDHIVQVWFYFKPYHITNPVIGSNDVIQYINNNSVLNKEYTVKVKYTQEFAGRATGTSVGTTNAEIISMVEGGYNQLFTPPIINANETSNTKWNKPKPVYSSSIITYEEGISPVTFAAIEDVNDDLFVSNTRVISKSVTKNYTKGIGVRGWSQYKSYTVTAQLEYTFKRIKDAGDTSVAALMTNIANNANSIKEDPYSYYKQVLAMKHNIQPVLDGDLIATGYTNEFIPIFATGAGEQNIRVDAATRMKPRNFVKMFKSSVDTGYTQESCHGWKCAFGFILAIVIIVVSFYFCGVCGTAVVDLVTAAQVFGAIALTLTLDVVVISLVQKALMANGQYQIAISMKGSIVMVNTLARITGYIAMVTGIGAMLQSARNAISDKMIEKAASKAAENVAGSTLQDVLAASQGVISGDTIVEYTLSDYIQAGYEVVKASLGSSFSYAGKSTMEMMRQGIDLLNKGFQIYSKWINPVKYPDSNSQNDSGVQEVPIHQASIDIINKEFDDYTFLDTDTLSGEHMVYQLTVDKVIGHLSKYYNA